MTDYRDFECMMFSTDILEKILAEKCSNEKLKNEKCEISDIRNKIIELGIPIGNIRFFSSYNKKGYKFDEIKFDKIFELKKSGF